MGSAHQVFAMRRAGRLAEALSQARELVDRHPDDTWCRRALGWVLVDLLKGDGPVDGALVTAAVELEVGDDDVLLRDHLARAVALRGPVGDGVRASRAGDHDRALAVLLDACRESPDSRVATEALLWARWRLLRDLAHADRPDVRQAIEVLRGLDAVPRPSLLASLTAAQVARLAGEWLDYGAWLRGWDMDASLRSEDLEAHTHEDHVTPALVDTLGRGLGRWLRRYHRVASPDLVAWGRETLLRLGERGDWWVRYACGRVLSDLGEPEAARPYLVDVVRGEPQPAWTWAALADTLEGEAQVDVLCRAVSGRRVWDGLRVRTAAAVAATDPAGARALLDAARELSERDERRRGRLLERLGPGEAALDGVRVRGRAAEPRWLGSEEVPGVLVRDCDGLACLAGDRRLRAPAELPDGAVPGTPVWVVLVGGRPARVLPREAEPWDGVRRRVGVVDHANPAKRVCHVVLADGGEALVGHVVAELAAGDHVAVVTVPDGRLDRAVVAEVLPGHPPADLARPYAGTLTVHVRGFGFARSAKHSVFVPPPLVQSTGLAEGTRVAGMAVRTDRGWAAVTLHEEG